MTVVALDVIQVVAGIATAFAVFLAWLELRHTKQQALTEFEDEFPREYRALSRSLPVKALLGEPLESPEAEQAKSTMFHYVDLCNEQVFLRQNGRVSTATWLTWCGGIESNLKLPAFNAAWEYIKEKSNSFAELRRLEDSNFRDDPINWGSTHIVWKRRSPDEPEQGLRKAA